jgi:tetratricopeptide (TPR) repeat protein
VDNGLVRSWDDGRFLIDFAPVRSVSWAHFVTIVSEPHFEAYHPLHLLSYWLDVPWAGVSGPAIHATSLVLWAVALVLLLECFSKLGLPLYAAVIGTLVVGVHPVQVEAVTWATGRKEVLALGFTCATILAHLRSRTLVDRAAWLARLFYVLAALSKTTVLPLPVVLFLIDVLLRDVPWKDALKRQAPLVVVGVALGALVLSIWQGAEMVRGDETSATLVAATYSHHLATAFFPNALCPVYPIQHAHELPLSAWLGPALLIVALLAATRLGARRIGFALGAFIVLLAPVSNVVPLYFQYQDRYLSLPLLGLGFGVAALIAKVAEAGAPRRNAALAVGAAVVLALGARTVQYGRVWASDLRLWGHAASVQPHAFYAWLNLGHVRRDAGELAAAIDAYDHAIDIAPELRLGYGARFAAIAMKDERDYGASGPDPLALGEQYRRQMDDADALRLLAGNLAERGYRNAVLVALGRSLDIEHIDDERLEQAAAIQAERGNLWLARFYVSRMGRPPIPPQLRALSNAE